jgi:hypothetical protein
MNGKSSAHQATDHRHPPQLLLQEELQQRNAPVEQVLQHQDVHPRLVVAVHEVPAPVVQSLDALHIPGRALGERHPRAVAADPRFGDEKQHRRKPPTHRFDRNCELQGSEEQQDRHPEQRIENEQDGGDDADQRRGQKIQHGEGTTPKARRGGVSIPPAVILRGRTT